MAINQTGKIGFGRALADYFRGYAQFRGRTTRAGFWWPQFLYILASLIFFSLIGLVNAVQYSFNSQNLATLGTGVDFSIPFLALYFLFLLGFFLPQLAILVRRLRDVGLNLAKILLLILLTPIFFGLFELFQSLSFSVLPAYLRYINLFSYISFMIFFVLAVLLVVLLLFPSNSIVKREVQTDPASTESPIQSAEVVETQETSRVNEAKPIELPEEKGTSDSKTVETTGGIKPIVFEKEGWGVSKQGHVGKVTDSEPEQPKAQIESNIETVEEFGETLKDEPVEESKTEKSDEIKEVEPLEEPENNSSEEPKD